MADVESVKFRQSFNSSMIPSPADLLLALPRLVSFTFSYLPEQLDDLFSIAKSPGRILADATSNARPSNATIITSGTTFLQSAASATARPTPTGHGDGFFAFAKSFSLSQSISNLDGVFSYIASRWAVSTFVIAVVLNRAHVYASSRRRLRLNWESRLILRIIPILLFLYQVETILQVIRCQTGPLLPEAKNGGGEILLNGSFTNEGGLLHRLSSILLFWQSESDSCHASGMIRPENPPTSVGSSSVLWPLFLSLCVSHFAETVSCALQGRQPMAETGMTIFEHSLAFAEAEAVVRSSAGLGLFALPKDTKSADETVAKLMTLSRSIVLQKLNVPPEVLLIALISSLSHLTSHTLAVFRLQSRFRLINTFIWGTCFMGAFLWSFVRFSNSGSDPNLAVIRYPTVCIIGFVPHFMVILGTVLCSIIYLISLSLTLISPPTPQHAEGSFWDRLKMARSNLQASAALSNIHISWRDEFYTTLMKVGFSVLTAASEAVYFNEGTQVTVATQTWLEGQRYSEVLAMARMSRTQQKRANFIPAEVQGNVVAEGLSMIDETTGSSSATGSTGFSRERKAGKAALKIGTAATREEGVGRSQHHGRLHLSLLLVRETLKLMVRCQAKLVIAILRVAGIERCPNWLRSLAEQRQEPRKDSALTRVQPTTLDFWMLSDDGTLHLPAGTSVDVELETRKRLALSEGHDDDREEHIDQNLYSWWQNGGFWGELDGSGDYQPSALDNEDTTSVLSTVLDSESEYGEDGRRTPTQLDYRDETPPSEDDTIQRLSRLLDPKTLEDRQEARLLARHLQKQGPVTRSQYRRLEDTERLRLLQPTQDPTDAYNTILTPDEEEELLEQLIRSRRNQLKSKGDASASALPGTPSATHSAGAETTPTAAADGASWSHGAEGMGAEGPQCVVCRSAPRTILVWPCRCLSLCEECRVSLAMNNFANCVCCRREVVAFSRLFVP